MTEDLSTLVLAYLLNEMDPLERSDFEVRLTWDPALAALLKSTADGLAEDLLTNNPAPPLRLGERNEMTAALLSAVKSLPVSPRRFRFKPYLWPAAAALLCALNLGQWLSHSRPSALTVDLVDGDRTAQGKRSTLVYSEPAPLHQAGVVPVMTTGARPSGPATSASGGSVNSSVSFSQTISIGAAPDAQHPYAWSAFDRARHQGVLDLHNLPAVAADRSLQFWVLPAGSKTFERVGEIPPQFYGHSGSVTYKLPSADANPAQILITIERRGGAPTVPSAAVVLHGP